MRSLLMRSPILEIWYGLVLGLLTFAISVVVYYYVLPRLRVRPPDIAPSVLSYIRTAQIRTPGLDLDGHVVLETRSGQCFLIVTRESSVGISPLPPDACRP